MIEYAEIHKNYAIYCSQKHGSVESIVVREAGASQLSEFISPSEWSLYILQDSLLIYLSRPFW